MQLVLMVLPEPHSHLAIVEKGMQMQGYCSHICIRRKVRVLICMHAAIPMKFNNQFYLRHINDVETTHLNTKVNYAVFQTFPDGHFVTLSVFCKHCECFFFLNVLVT